MDHVSRWLVASYTNKCHKDRWIYAHILHAAYFTPTKVCTVYTGRNRTATALISVNLCRGYERILREEEEINSSATVTDVSQNIILDLISVTDNRDCHGALEYILLIIFTRGVFLFLVIRKIRSF